MLSASSILPTIFIIYLYHNLWPNQCLGLALLWLHKCHNSATYDTKITFSFLVQHVVFPGVNYCLNFFYILQTNNSPTLSDKPEKLLSTKSHTTGNHSHFVLFCCCLFFQWRHPFWSSLSSHLYLDGWPLGLWHSCPPESSLQLQWESLCIFLCYIQCVLCPMSFSFWVYFLAQVKHILQ